MNVERKAELKALLRNGDKRCKLVEPKNTKSCVWRFFNLVHYEGRQEPYACCKTCSDLLSYSGKTGTGSLLRHRCLHSNNGKNVRVSKAKNERSPIRVPKPKILPEAQPNEAGALPPKWEQYEPNEEISDDIKDIIYSEDPLCYSPIHDPEEEHSEKMITNKASTVVSPVMNTSVVTAPATNSHTKSLKGSLDTSIDRLTHVSEQLSFVIQHTQEEQNKDDDYYFALSLVPIMRQLSLNRKLYVRSKIQEILFRESEHVSIKPE